MIKYYITDISKLSDPVLNLSSMADLSNERQKKCLKYIQADDRKRCLGAGKIIKKILEDFEVKSEITYGYNGKPECEDIYFNVSHSGNYVIGVAGDVSVGCDIEYIVEAPIEVANYYFHSSEIDFIQKSNNKSKAFWKLWTLKESYMKMTGEGVSLSLNSFNVEIGNKIIVYRNGVKQNCTFKHLWLGEHSVAICVNNNDEIFDENIVWTDVI